MFCKVVISRTRQIDNGLQRGVHAFPAKNAANADADDGPLRDIDGKCDTENDGGDGEAELNLEVSARRTRMRDAP